MIKNLRLSCGFIDGDDNELVVVDGGDGDGVNRELVLVSLIRFFKLSATIRPCFTFIFNIRCRLISSSTKTKKKQFYSFILFIFYEIPFIIATYSSNALT
jgi:hypothetical protein